MKKEKIHLLIEECAKDILTSDNMAKEKMFMQHGNTTVFDHSYSVAYKSIRMARILNIKVDEKSLIRGCLLHDYFLYDWHDKTSHGKHHGTKHASIALTNALREYELNEVEINMIYSHMFPLNLKLPKYKESVLLCISDKTCATKELFTFCFQNMLNFYKRMI